MKEYDPSHKLTFFTYILRRAFPELWDIYNEHIADYDEELPYVFMGDVKRYLIDKPNKDIVDTIKLHITNGNPEVIEMLKAQGFEELMEEDNEEPT